MNLTDLSTVRDIMDRFGISTKKKYGQNFLINQSVPERIAKEGTGIENCGVLEIGPGIGTLTACLCKNAKKVVAVEIDDSLIPVLDYTLAEFDNVTVLHADILKTPLQPLMDTYFSDCDCVYVCANLPYYITTPILMALLESGLPFEYITIMIQSEVADRLCAKAGSKEYGAITAVLKYYGEAEKLFKVSAGNFIPAPKVDSTVVRIRLHKQKPYVPKDEETLFKTIRAAFEQRRKTLPNALSAGFPEIPKETLTALIEECGHRPDIRGERLDIADFVALADKIFEVKYEA